MGILGGNLGMGPQYDPSSGDYWGSDSVTPMGSMDANYTPSWNPNGGEGAGGYDGGGGGYEPYPDYVDWNPNEGYGGGSDGDWWGQAGGGQPGGGSGLGFDFDPSSLYKGARDWFTSGPGGGGADDPYWMERLGLVGSAINNMNNSGKYMDLATKYAHQVNPFDLAQREYYQQKLKGSYEDPTAFLNDPGHKAAQERNLNKIQGRMRAGGYMGSGNEALGMSEYISESDAQYLQKEREMLSRLAGADISPAAAAGLIGQGIQGSVQAQNDALASAFQALSPRQGPSTVINNNNSSRGGGDGGTGVGARDYLRNFPAGAVAAGLDKWGNTIMKIGQRIVGIMGKDGSYYPNDPESDFGGAPRSEDTYEDGTPRGSYEDYRDWDNTRQWWENQGPSFGGGGGYEGEGTGIGDLGFGGDPEWGWLENDR